MWLILFILCIVFLFIFNDWKKGTVGKKMAFYLLLCLFLTGILFVGLKFSVSLTGWEPPFAQVIGITATDSYIKEYKKSIENEDWFGAELVLGKLRETWPNNPKVKALHKGHWDNIKTGIRKSILNEPEKNYCEIVKSFKTGGIRNFYVSIAEEQIECLHEVEASNPKYQKLKEVFEHYTQSLNQKLSQKKIAELEKEIEQLK